MEMGSLAEKAVVLIIVLTQETYDTNALKKFCHIESCRKCVYPQKWQFSKNINTPQGWKKFMIKKIRIF